VAARERVGATNLGEDAHGLLVGLAADDLIERIDHLGIPLRSLVFAKDRHDPRPVHSLAVLAGVGHRVVGVAGGHDPRTERDIASGQLVRVAMSVDAFMMATYERCSRPEPAVESNIRKSMVTDGSFLFAQAKSLMMLSSNVQSAGLAARPLPCHQRKVSAAIDANVCWGSQPMSFRSRSMEKIVLRFQW
jgi:hypothetical protein